MREQEIAGIVVICFICVTLLFCFSKRNGGLLHQSYNFTSTVPQVPGTRHQGLGTWPQELCTYQPQAPAAQRELGGEGGGLVGEKVPGRDFHGAAPAAAPGAHAPAAAPRRQLGFIDGRRGVFLAFEGPRGHLWSGIAC